MIKLGHHDEHLQYRNVLSMDFREEWEQFCCSHLPKTLKGNFRSVSHFFLALPNIASGNESHKIRIMNMGIFPSYKHTRVEPVGRVAKMNWLNYDMGMNIHAICDAKNAILKYFSLDMRKFAQIWAFFFLLRRILAKQKVQKNVFI